MKYDNQIFMRDIIGIPFANCQSIAERLSISKSANKLNIWFRIVLFLSLNVVVAQAHAGLFNDDVARKQIKEIELRLQGLAESSKQQVRTLIDLQSQIENISVEARSLRGQSEELAHKLEEADKRQKDFYVDLDTRLRNFEPTFHDAAQPAIDGEDSQPIDNPAAANRAFEFGHSLFKSGKHQDAVIAFQDFIAHYPNSVYLPNAYYELATSYFFLNEYKTALQNYSIVTKKYGFSAKAADAWLGKADCQQALKQRKTSKKTLRRLISKFPSSDAAKEAKQRLAKQK